MGCISVFLKRFCWFSEEKCAQTQQTGKYLIAINASSRHCLNVVFSVLFNTEREFPPGEPPIARYSRVVHRAWSVIVRGKLTSLMLDDKCDDEGWIRQKSSSDAVLQSARCVGLCELEFYTWSSNSLSCHHVCTKPMESCRCQRFWCHHFNLANNHWSAPLLP